MISIVMSYFNRLDQFTYTLKTIDRSSYKDVEIVIVDDFSDSDQSLDHLPKQFPHLKFKIIKMRDQLSKKNYCNPCIPYNVAFRASSGDKIIIQNPECCHIGDVVQHVQDNLTDTNYLSYHCYASTKADLEYLHNDREMPMWGHKKNRWYNHVTERPAAFHFTCAISRNNLVKLNGFDERYALGQDYDDAELVHRIKLLGLNIEFVADPWVIHQYHKKTYNNPNNPPVVTNNKELYEALLVNGTVRVDNNGNDICGI